MARLLKIRGEEAEVSVELGEGPTAETLWDAATWTGRNHIRGIKLGYSSATANYVTAGDATIPALPFGPVNSDTTRAHESGQAYSPSLIASAFHVAQAIEMVRGEGWNALV